MMKRIDLAPHLKYEHPLRNSSSTTSIKEALCNHARSQEQMAKEQSQFGNKDGPTVDERSPVGTKTAVLGSPGLTCMETDRGFFSTVLDCYNHHCVLRTCPEDWWYCIIQKVAQAIDANSKKEEVRKFFVQHEGKKELVVRVGPSIYGVDYSWFFDQMSQQIAKNINVPAYVDLIRADFGSTTKVQKIVSEVTLMSSLQEFFEFTMCLMCGIPAVEMKGEREDWVKIGTKMEGLRSMLKPLEKVLGLEEWFKSVGKILSKLVDTYDGKPDKKWWSKIITVEGFGSGPREWKGWFIVDFLGQKGCHGPNEIRSGLVSVPMKITDGTTNEDSAVVAGIGGYEVIPAQKEGEAPALAPVHGWCLALEPNAKFRADMTDWEKKHGGA